MPFQDAVKTLQRSLQSLGFPVTNHWDLRQNDKEVEFTMNLGNVLIKHEPIQNSGVFKTAVLSFGDCLLDMGCLLERRPMTWGMIQEDSRLKIIYKCSTSHRDVKRLMGDYRSAVLGDVKYDPNNSRNVRFDDPDVKITFDNNDPWLRTPEAMDCEDEDDDIEVIYDSRSPQLSDVKSWIECKHDPSDQRAVIVSDEPEFVGTIWTKEMKEEVLERPLMIEIEDDDDEIEIVYDSMLDGTILICDVEEEDTKYRPYRDEDDLLLDADDGYPIWIDDDEDDDELDLCLEDDYDFRTPSSLSNASTVPCNDLRVDTSCTTSVSPTDTENKPPDIKEMSQETIPINLPPEKNFRTTTGNVPEEKPDEKPSEENLSRAVDEKYEPTKNTTLSTSGPPSRLPQAFLPLTYRQGLANIATGDKKARNIKVKQQRLPPIRTCKTSARSQAFIDQPLESMIIATYADLLYLHQKFIVYNYNRFRYDRLPCLHLLLGKGFTNRGGLRLSLHWGFCPRIICHASCFATIGEILNNIAYTIPANTTRHAVCQVLGRHFRIDNHIQVGQIMTYFPHQAEFQATVILIHKNRLHLDFGWKQGISSIRQQGISSFNATWFQ